MPELVTLRREDGKILADVKDDSGALVESLEVQTKKPSKKDA
jgi:hypothetical protein